jgi:hypothetical protein
MQLDLHGQKKLTRQEAAARLRVHIDTLDRWADAGLIRPMRYPSPNGRRPTIRYTIAEIDRFEPEAMSRLPFHTSTKMAERRADREGSKLLKRANGR